MVGFLFSQEEGEKSEVVISLPPEDPVRRLSWTGQKEALMGEPNSQHLDLGLWCSRTVKDKFLLLKSLGLWYFVLET